MADPTQAEAERVLTMTKTIGENVIWRSQPGRTPRWRFDVSIATYGVEEPLRLVGNYGKGSWSFALLMSNAPIRRCDCSSKGHINPGGVIIAEPHKHRWDDVHRDREAYVPEDIDFSDVNQAFFDFLAECNVTFVGRYNPLMPL